MAALFVAGLTLSVDGRVGAQGPRAEPPATPTGLTGTFTHESVSLSWDDSGDPSITGYQILRRQRGVHDVGDFQVHVDDTDSAATSYVDTAVEAEASYVYRVKARNSSGLSERSRFFRADLPAAPDPPAPGLPGPPPNLTAEAAGETQIDLSWTAPEDTNGSEIVGYRIEVSTDAGTSWNDLVAGASATITTYAHTGLVSGATRHYRVSAINSVGTGAPSNIASATTGDLTPPRFVAGVVGADGDSLDLYFNESLDLDPRRTPLASSFAVTADGAPVAVGAVQVIPGRAQSVSLIGLSPAIREGQTASVSYTDPTSGNDEAAIQDRAGNDAASLADQPVTNGSTLTGASTRGAPAQDVVTQPATATATAQIGAILAAKAQRTPAQRKVSSRLLDSIGNAQLPEGQEEGGEKPQPPARSGPRRPAATDGVAEFEFVTVDIRADVTPEVLGRIRALGGTVINSVPKYRAIRAQLPLVAVQPLAALSAVQSIRPADEAVTHKNTSEGDAAHLVNTARTTHGVTGSGIGIGVLSNGVETLAARQASGDLPAQVAVLPGQEGSGDEGTAMLEILHDLAPGAELYFATGFSGQAQFAANIEALCEAGADVIVDDINYYLEANFQDSIITQGVNAATANGCYFFSSAGNAGNLNGQTSGVWEGDYVAGTSMIVGGSTAGVRHDFGGGKEENAVRGAFFGFAVLQWADPLGASANDYDLFLVDGDGNVLLSSTDTQDGAQDPIEAFSLGFFAFEGVRLVIVKVSGEARYLRLQLFPAKLQIATAGATFGHSASENTVGVGQVDVRTAGGAGGIFDGTESVTASSSDGPRRLFYEPDGTPITPGNFSSTGGKVLQKPDLSAASCVSTATPGFSTFCGTSAAAPHAAAIAALMLAAAGGPAHVTPADLRMKMTATTAVLDIEKAGFDNKSGAGIVMAPGAIAGVAVADRNGAPTVTTTLADRTLVAGLGPVTIDLASIFTDPDSDTLTYSVVSSDPDRLGVTLSGTEVTLTPGSPGWSAVWARVTDPGGLGALQTFTVTVTAGNADYDTDNDGLIEVSTLAQLDAMRYDLNGNGLVDGATWEPYYAAFSMGALEMGCPNGCVGYELAANLDFDTDGSGAADSPDTYWNDGAGWKPIGSEDNPYTANFRGENHTLANLFINRPTEDGIGLFGEVHHAASDGLIQDVGLVEVDVTGRDAVGALFGRSTYMSVIWSYATGRVTGRGDRVGGLAGESSGNLVHTYAAVEVSGEEAVGGLVGHHILNRITTSYATGRVSGMYAVGGLVGATSDFFHLIQASYATGDVSGVGARLSTSDSGFIVCGFGGTDDAETGSGGGIGGLVGHSCGRIEASYATGAVSGGAAAGGLLGSGLHGSIGFSYWDMETSGIRVGVGEEDTNDNGVVDGAELQRASLVGMTTAALQGPTDYDGIYSAWAVDLGGPGFGDGEPDELWDFGATTQYPALSVDLNGDARATWQEFGYQFRSALALTATTTSGQAQVDLSWAAADVRPWTPAPSVTYTVYRDDGFTVVAVAEDLTGTVYADTAVARGARYSYQVAAVVGGGEVVRSARAPVTAGAANQPPVAAGILADRTLLLRTDAVTVDVAAAFRDPDGDTLTHAAASSAPSVASVSVSGSEVAITPETGGRAIITVTVTDSVGSNPSATQRFTVTVGNDYDSDDDGLIEIRTLAQLDAMRHNLDGGVIPDDRAAFALAFPAPLDRMGCGLEGCSGYELMADLDFDTDGSGTANAGDTYWNGGAGWAPIGIPEFLSSGAFSTTLDGNDHVIANLFVNGGDYAGLFGALGESGVIRNLSLTDIDVTGEYSAGGLVGQNAGTVIASHATGTVRGQDLVGGLVGDNYYGGSITRSSSLATATSPPSPPICPPPCVVVSSEPRGAGGLVGLNRGTIDSSYATGDVTGYPAGGLVGWNSGGGIIASYAAGAVTGTTVGGLVGRNDGPSVFETSYATGRVSGNLDVGGLVGTNASGITASYSTGPASATSSTDSSVGGLVGANESGFHRIRASYWDSTTSGIAGGQSTAALQGPTGDTGIYGAWNGPWHFGTSSQYPALSVDFDGNGDETWQEFGHQLRAGPELTATGGEGLVVLNWLPVDAGHWTPPPGITYTLYRDATVVAENLSTLSYQDSGLTAGDYTYQLAAVVNGGEATRSALVTATVIEIIPNNQPQFPSSETGARSVDENTAAGMDIGTAIAAEDADDDTLTYSIAGADAAFFDVVTPSGQLQTRTALDRESRATYSFTMSVRDGKDIDGNADTRVDDRITVTVTIADVDEPPDISFVATGGVTVNDNALTVDENHDRSLATFTAADPEREPGLTYEWSVVRRDRGDFAVTDDGVLSFAAIPDYEHPADSGENNVYDITVKALDSDGKTGELRVTVTVRDVNETPEFPSTENGMRGVPENTPAGRNVGNPVAAVAGDNDTLTYSITRGANLFDINTATGQLLTKAPLDREAAPSHTIRVGVSDGKDANNMAEDPPVVDNTISVTVTVTDVDEAPKVMGPEAVTKAENSGTSVGAYTADDPEIKAVTWETLRGADAGHFAFDDGALSFVSEPDFEARPDNTYEVTVRARDEGGHIGELRVTVTVTNVDERPTIDGPANVDYAEGGTGNVATYRAVDPEGATIIWTLAGAQGGKFTITNGVLKFRETPDFEERPSYALIVEASDGNPRNVASIDVTITVSNANEPPVVSGITEIERFEDNATGTLANYTADDPDGNDVIWDVIGVDRNDFVIDASGALSFKDPVDYDDPSDSNRDNIFNIEVTATEDGGPQPLRGKLPVTVTILDVNETPEFPSTEDGMRSVPENTPARRNVGAPVAAVAGDNDTLTYSITRGANLFDINTATGQLLTKAPLDREAAPSHTIRVGVSDGKDANNMAEDPPVVDNRISVTIAVGDVDEAPKVMGREAVTKAENSGTFVGRYTATDPEGEDVTWTTLTGADARHFAFDNGALSFVSEPDFEARPDNTYEVTVRARDEGGHIGERPVTVTVTNVNEPPILDGLANVDYAEGGTGNVATYRAVDPEGATIIWTLAGAQGDDFTITNGVLRFRETPDYEEASSYQLTVIASDGNPLIVARQDVTVDITNLEEEGKLTLSSDQPSIGVAFTATLADPDGVRSSTWEWRRADSRSAAGVVIAGATGETYTPTGDDRDKYLRVKVVYTDGHGAGKEKEAVSKFATQPDRTTNTAPSFPANPDSLSVREDARGSTVGDPVVATDEEHDPITYSLTVSGAPVDPPFTIDRSSGQIRVAAGVALDHETRPSHSVTVTATDSFNAEGSTTVTIEVTNVNEAPAVTGRMTIQYAENGGDAVASYRADDPENQAVDWTPRGLDAGLFQISSSGELAFRSPPDREMPKDSGENNVYDVTVQATDRPPTGTPLTGTRDVTIRVTNVDEPPEVMGTKAVTKAENSGEAVGDYTATDPENKALTWETLMGADAGHFAFDNGALSFKENPDYEARPDNTYEVTVRARDEGGNVGELPVIVTVDDVDEPPEVMGTKAVTKAENSGEAVGDYTATDPENKAVTWETLRGADAGHFAFDDGTLSFVSEPDFEARRDNTYEVTVRARDEGGKIGELPVTVTLINVNERPTITGAAEASIEEEGTLFVDAYTASDPESATIAWQPLVGSDADKFEFNTSNGRLAFKAAPDFEDADRRGDNEYDVTLTVSAGGHTITFDVAVTVTNKEEPGMLALPPTQPQADADYTATLSDPDDVQSTTWTWERSTSRSGPWATVTGAFDSTTTSVYTPIGTPVTGDVGHYLRVTAAYTDGYGSNEISAVSTNSVLAAPVGNRPPEFMETNPTRSVAENAGANATVGRAVTATDPDQGNTVRYEFESPVPDLFTIDGSSGQIRVKTEGSLDYDDPANRTQRVTVKALDSSNAFDTVQVTIEVTNVNEPPAAVADAPFRFDEDTEIEIRVLANDSDPEDERSELLLTVVTPPLNGRATVNAPANAGENSTITYEPNADYNGSDTFTYQVRDTGSPSLSSTASVTVQIDAVNDAPVFPPSETGARFVSESAKAGANVGSAVTATDVDENDTLTYSLFGADASSFEIDSNGQITVGDGVTFDIATKDTYTVMVEADDRNGGTDSIEVTITVTAGPVGPPIITGGGGGGGGGGPSGPSPSEVDLEWNVKRDIEELDGGHDKPTGSWSDGTTLWLAENGDGADDAVYAYDLKTGERVEEREFELDETNRAPRGLWSNGQTAWVADSGRDRLFAYDLESGERDEEREVELDQRNRDPRGIWSEGTTVWVLDGGKNALFAYDLETGALLGEYALDSSNGDPHGIWSDGVSVWVSDHGAKRLFAYRIPVQDSPAAGDVLPLERVRDEEFANLSRASNNSPRGIWSDGAVMYVADESDGRVYSYNMPDAIDARLASLTLSGVDIGEFDPGKTEYDGVAAEGVTETTVEAGAVQRRTDVAIHPPDADDANGHQVALQDLGEITVTVTSADGNRRRVYRVRFEETEREAPSYPTSRCFRGDVVEGFSLLIYEGGSLEDLVVCAVSRYVVALYVLDNGVYVPYILGAPDFVNRSFHGLFPDGLPPMTSLVAASNGPPSADTVVGRLAEDEPVTLRGSNCLHGEIAAGFSLVIFEGGSVEELEACGRGLGITAFHALHEGDWAPFILGAPDFVNRPFFELFADGLPALTPLVATRDSPPAANADSDEAAEN